MKPLHVKTPLIQSQQLKNTLGKQIYFKLELLQPPSSFKIRGIGYTEYVFQANFNSQKQFYP